MFKLSNQYSTTTTFYYILVIYHIPGSLNILLMLCKLDSLCLQCDLLFIVIYFFVYEENGVNYDSNSRSYGYSVDDAILIH